MLSIFLEVNNVKLHMKMSVFIPSKPPNANFSIRSSLISLGCDLSSERLGNMKLGWIIHLRFARECHELVKIRVLLKIW